MLPVPYRRPFSRNTSKNGLFSHPEPVEGPPSRSNNGRTWPKAKSPLPSPAAPKTQTTAGLLPTAFQSIPAAGPASSWRQNQISVRAGPAGLHSLPRLRKKLLLSRSCAPSPRNGRFLINLLYKRQRACLPTKGISVKAIRDPRRRLRPFGLLNLNAS